MTGAGAALRPLADCLALDPARGHRRLSGPGPDWAALLQLANEELVTPALCSRLIGLRRLGSLPAEVAEYLTLLHRLNGDRNGALRRQALELVGALNRFDIRPVLLKGAAALFADAYGDPAARMVGDIDILVPRLRLRASLAVLADLGYRLADRYPEGHHAYGEFVRDGDAGALDLHVEPIDASYLLSAEEVARRAAPCAEPGAAFAVPSPTDRVLHNILHAQIHHRADYYRGTIRLRQLHDGATLATSFASAIDWDLIERRFAAQRLDAALQSYLLAAGDLFGLPWPLAARPALRARLHYRRCLVQRHVPGLARILVPWANLRRGFAGHRLRNLYGSRRGAARRVLRHAGQFFRKARARGVIAQLFRA
ncbi:MAG TPA: nucleotidyltransferase family protein [Alphaproteobacteria bacterium]|jgi:hypothetical protein|nr:nucleotidyltransferase family protein [Alphaproteobacteria bacterium]